MIGLFSGVALLVLAVAGLIWIRFEMLDLERSEAEYRRARELNEMMIEELLKVRVTKLSKLNRKEKT